MSEADLPADPIKASSILLRQNRPVPEILALISAIADGDPRFFAAQHVRALCALREGDPQLARTLLLEVLRHDATRIGAWLTLAQATAALDMPDDLLTRLREVALRAPPPKRTAFITELLQALDFVNTEQHPRKDAVFAGFLLPLLAAALDQRDMDTAMNLEGLMYRFYIKAREEDRHFARCMDSIAPLFTRAGHAWRETLPPLPRPALARPYRIGFFIHSASVLAHIEVLLNTLKGYKALDEQPFEPIVYCFFGKSLAMEQALAALGVRLVMLNEHFPETKDSSWQRLLRLRELLSQDGVQELVWVSYVTILPLAFGLRLAPVQTFWAMKYRNFSQPDIDGYVTGSALTRFGELCGRTWRMGILGVDDWYDASLEAEAARIRASLGDSVVVMTLARAEKMQDPAYLQATVAMLRANPQAIFVWAGREEHPAVAQALAAGGVADRTRFIGWVNTRLYAQVADVFVDTFPFPCGFTLFQAMAASKPVVIYDSYEAAQTALWNFLQPMIDGDAGTDEQRAELHAIVGPADDPLISIARSPQHYVELAGRLINDPALRQTAGEASRRFMARYFSDPKASAQSYASHFVELIEEKAAEGFA